MDCSTPGLPVLHHLPEFAQTHVHWVSDAIQPSCLVIPFSSCLQSFPASPLYLADNLLQILDLLSPGSSSWPPQTVKCHLWAPTACPAPLTQPSPPGIITGGHQFAFPTGLGTPGRPSLSALCPQRCPAQGWVQSKSSVFMESKRLGWGGIPWC